MDIIRRFSVYFHKYRVYAVLAVICIVVEMAFELIIPLIMADLIDIGVANGDTAFIFRQGALMCLCAVLALILGIGSARFVAACGNGLAAEIRKAEYAKIQSFSFANRDRFRTESLVTRLTSDVTTIQNAIISGMRPGVRGPFMMVMSIAMGFAINPKLAVIFLIAAPVLAIFLVQIVRRVGPLYSTMQGAIDQVNRVVQENLTAIRIVKAYVRGDYESEKFGEVNDNLKSVSTRSFSTAVLNMPAMQFVMYTTILCILWIGGGMIQTGDLQVGKLTGFLSYVLQVLNSLMMISNVFLLLTRAGASAHRILEVFDEPLDLADADGANAVVEHGSVRFEHVSFQYRTGSANYVLSDINLDIKAGETVGIIGGTGSSKSTLVQLIPRLYEATKGTVYVDGRPVREYPLAHLRDAIAMVLQKNTLFSGTVKDNLRWGKADATDAEIEEACRVACVDEFIGRLDNGYDTDLGQGGVNVSGGQKQRLCIARAILKKPKVLILDDSTSAVDMVTEAKLREGLAKCLPDTTKIIIAQRISSVLHADKIVVLNDGRIDAVGDHWSLMESNEIYRDIYQSQQEGAGL